MGTRSQRRRQNRFDKNGTPDKGFNDYADNANNLLVNQNLLIDGEVPTRNRRQLTNEEKWDPKRIYQEIIMKAKEDIDAQYFNKVAQETMLLSDREQGGTPQGGPGVKINQEANGGSRTKKSGLKHAESTVGVKKLNPVATYFVQKREDALEESAKKQFKDKDKFKQRMKKQQDTDVTGRC